MQSLLGKGRSSPIRLTLPYAEIFSIAVAFNFSCVIEKAEGNG